MIPSSRLAHVFGSLFFPKEVLKSFDRFKHSVTKQDVKTRSYPAGFIDALDVFGFRVIITGLMFFQWKLIGLIPIDFVGAQKNK